MGMGEIVKIFDYNADNKTTTEYIVKNIPIFNAVLRVPSTGFTTNIIDDYEKTIVKRNNDYKIEMANIAQKIADDYGGDGTISNVEIYINKLDIKNTITTNLKAKDDKIFDEENDVKEIKDNVIRGIMLKGDNTQYGNDFQSMFAVKKNYEELAYLIYDYKKRDEKQYQDFKQHFKEKKYINPDFFNFIENDISIVDGYPVFYYQKTFKDNKSIKVFNVIKK